MHQGEIRQRVDVNYRLYTQTFNDKYSNSLFPLIPIGNLTTLIQYGISDRATLEPQGIPILRMSNLQANGWDFTEIKYVELEEETKSNFLLENGDILFNRTNSKELVGKCDVFSELGEWTFASYLIRVRLDQTKALPQFVSDFLNTQAGRIQIDRVSRQIIGMSNVNAEELRELLIPVPPIPTQQHLVNKMNLARASRREKLAQADALLGSLDAWLLEQLGIKIENKNRKKVFGLSLDQLSLSRRIDAGYYLPEHVQLINALHQTSVPLVALSDLCLAPVGGATPTRSEQNLYSNASDGVHFLRIMNIEPNSFNLDDVKHITSEVHNGELQRSILDENDVLMTITGRVGTAAVVSKEILPANINQHIVRLRILDNRCLPAYLAIYLNSSIGLAISNRGVTGGTRMALDYAAIRSLLVPIPAIDVQNEIIQRMLYLKNQQNHLCAEAEAEWQAAKLVFERALLKGA